MAAVELPVPSPRDNLSAVLESDLRLLSAETRRSEGFTSWLTGPDFPQIKEAAERGVLKLRSTTGRNSSAEAVQKSKVGWQCLPDSAALLTNILQPDTL
jgi:hypothetical protein